MPYSIASRAGMLAAGAIALCVAGACTASRHQGDVPAEVTPTGAWTILGELPAMPEGLVLRYPSLAIGRDHRFVAGTLLAPDSATEAGRPHLGHVGGPALPMPPGDFRFWYPHGVFDDDGTYHFVWGEGDDPANALSWPMPKELWHAAYSDGRWSAPVRILSSERIDLMTATSPLAIDGPGCVHVVVTVAPSSDPMALMHVRGHCAPWSVTRVAGMVTYASVAAMGPFSVVIALAGRDTTNPHARNVVQVLRSDSGGAWRPVSKIEIGDPLSRTHRVWTGHDSGNLHVAWSQETSSGESIIHVRSTDAGRTWRDTSISEPITGVLATYFTARTCGVVAIVEKFSNGTIELLDVDVGVPAPRATPIFPDVWLSADPALGVADDSLLLVGSVSRTGEAAAARLAVRQPCRTAHSQR